MTTTSSIEMSGGINALIEQLHSEFSQDIRPPCKVLCYTVSAGYSQLKNNKTCTTFANLHCTEFLKTSSFCTTSDVQNQFLRRLNLFLFLSLRTYTSLAAIFVIKIR